MVTFFGLRQNQPPPGISQEEASKKTFAMTLIDIDDLFPKELDIDKLARDASSAPPYPKTHDGGDAMLKAVQESPSQNIPPWKG